jgi:hypothetical protein
VKNILTAIYGKFTGSAFSTDVGGRIYLDEAPAGAEFPYCVFQIVTYPVLSFQHINGGDRDNNHV